MGNTPIAITDLLFSLVSSLICESTFGCCQVGADNWRPGKESECSIHQIPALQKVSCRRSAVRIMAGATTLIHSCEVACHLDQDMFSKSGNIHDG
jgi:hypothetical protein